MLNFRLLSALMAMAGLGKAVERHNVAPEPGQSRGKGHGHARPRRYNRNGRWGADTPCRCGFGLRTRDCERLGHDRARAERQIALWRSERLGQNQRAA